MRAARRHAAQLRGDGSARACDCVAEWERCWCQQVGPVDAPPPVGAGSMLRLLCSLRAPYDPLDEREEELPPPPAMDSNPGREYPTIPPPPPPWPPLPPPLGGWRRPALPAAAIHPGARCVALASDRFGGARLPITFSGGGRAFFGASCVM